MKLSLLVLSGALLSTSLLNASTIIYTNFGTNFDYTSGSGLTAGSGAAVPFLDTAVAPNGFVYVLSTITVAAYNGLDPNDAADPVTISLYADNSGVPGTLLASQSAVLTNSSDAPPEVLSVSFSNGPILSDGAQYWVALSDPFGNVTWNSNDTGAQGAATFSTDTSEWTSQPSYTQGAVEVDASLVAAVPEPGTFAMLGGGCFALAFLTGRRRFAARRRFTAPAV